MFIDFHTHAFAEKIADKALLQLRDYYHIKITHRGRMEDLLDSAAKARLDALVLLVAATKPQQVKPANDWILSLLNSDDSLKSGVMRGSDRLKVIPFGTFHVEDPFWQKEIQRLRSLGIRGIKLHPEFQRIDLADARLHDFFAEIEKDFILMIHVGDFKKTGNNLSTPEKVKNILIRFPKLRIIAAHMGGYRFWEEALECLAGQNVYLDTSSSFSYMPPDLLQKFISRHDIEKILFGSDYPVTSPLQELHFIQHIPWLSESQKALILGMNAKRLLEL